MSEVAGGGERSKRRRLTRARRARPVRRHGPGRIEVDLAPWVLDFLESSAQRIRDAPDDPGSVAFSRLFARVEESGGLDEPLVMLFRQEMLEEIASTVTRSCRKRLISDDEAEAWLKLLGMALSVRCAELGVRTEEDRSAIDAEDDQLIAAVHVLQMLLIEALESDGAS